MNELGRKSIDEFKRSQKIPVIIVLENIRSMYNVGSVFRTADAFLIAGIFVFPYLLIYNTKKEDQKYRNSDVDKLPGCFLFIYFFWIQ